MEHKSELIEHISLSASSKAEIIEAFMERQQQNNDLRNTRYTAEDISDVIDDCDRLMDSYTGGDGKTYNEYVEELKKAC